MRLTVIYNPSAGGGGHSEEALEATLRSLGHEPHMQSRKAPGVEDAVARPAEAIVLAGGDGTVSKLLHLLVERGLPLAVLPLGTANNLALSLGVSGSVESLAAGWRSARPRRLDLGVVECGGETRLFVGGCGAGALAEAMRRKDKSGAEGEAKLRRARETLRRALAEARPADPRATADGERLPPDLLFLEATNISRLGPRVALAPSAEPDDGMLEIVYARPSDRGALLEWLREEGEAGPPPVPTVRARRVDLAAPPAVARIDDGFMELADGPLKVELNGAFVEILI